MGKAPTNFRDGNSAMPFFPEAKRLASLMRAAVQLEAPMARFYRPRDGLVQRPGIISSTGFGGVIPMQESEHRYSPRPSARRLCSRSSRILVRGNAGGLRGCQAVMRARVMRGNVLAAGFAQPAADDLFADGGCAYPPSRRKPPRCPAWRRPARRIRSAALRIYPPVCLCQRGRCP